MSVRLQQNRHLGVELVTRLYRVSRLAGYHDHDNQAFKKVADQLIQTVRALNLLEERSARILFLEQAVLVGTQFLKAPRATFELAGEVRDRLKLLGANEITFDSEVSTEDIGHLAAILYDPEGHRHEGERLKADGAVRFRSIDLDGLSRRARRTERERMVYRYASAIVVVRRLYEQLKDGDYVMVPQLKRVSQSLIDLAADEQLLLLGVGSMRNASYDDAGCAVNAAILAVAALRGATDDVELLGQLAMATLLADVGRPRAAGMADGQPKRVRAIPLLDERNRERMGASTAAVLAALGRLHDRSLPRLVISFEAERALYLEELDAVYSHGEVVSPHGLLIATVWRYINLLRFDVRTQAQRDPEVALGLMWRDARNDDERALVSRLARALGVLPAGTPVESEQGWLGVVVAGSQAGARLSPRVRFVLDGATRRISPVEVDLSTSEAAQTYGPVNRVLDSSVHTLLDRLKWEIVDGLEGGWSTVPAEATRWSTQSDTGDFKVDVVLEDDTQARDRTEVATPAGVPSVVVVDAFAAAANENPTESETPLSVPIVIEDVPGFRRHRADSGSEPVLGGSGGGPPEADEESLLRTYLESMDEAEGKELANSAVVRVRADLPPGRDATRNSLITDSLTDMLDDYLAPDAVDEEPVPVSDASLPSSSDVSPASAGRPGPSELPSPNVPPPQVSVSPGDDTVTGMAHRAKEAIAGYISGFDEGAGEPLEGKSGPTELAETVHKPPEAAEDTFDGLPPTAQAKMDQYVASSGTFTALEVATRTLEQSEAQTLLKDFVPEAPATKHVLARVTPVSTPKPPPVSDEPVVRPSESMAREAFGQRNAHEAATRKHSVPEPAPKAPEEPLDSPASAPFATDVEATVTVDKDEADALLEGFVKSPLSAATREHSVPAGSGGLMDRPAEPAPADPLMGGLIDDFESMLPDALLAVDGVERPAHGSSEPVPPPVEGQRRPSGSVPRYAPATTPPRSADTTTMNPDEAEALLERFVAPSEKQRPPSDSQPPPATAPDTGRLPFELQVPSLPADDAPHTGPVDEPTKPVKTKMATTPKFAVLKRRPRKRKRSPKDS